MINFYSGRNRRQIEISLLLDACEALYYQIKFFTFINRCYIDFIIYFTLFYFSPTIPNIQQGEGAKECIEVKMKYKGFHI